MEGELIAVIGGNYGDEGKGRLTNALAGDTGMVVRFSGSAQAGHTVVEKGHRHVFKHFGSATMRGGETFLGESFLIHPIMYAIERAQLQEFMPVMAADKRSLVVLPSDMIINQAVEKRRTQRHGSCGMGVRQAQERSTVPLLRVTAEDLQRGNVDLAALSRQHLRLWHQMNGLDLQESLGMLGIGDLDEVFERYGWDVEKFTNHTHLMDADSSSEWLYFNDTTVFEGSQGLALDPGVGQLPHLTPSHVGVGGLASFFAHNEELFPAEIELVYATRPYLTRHGAGPLPFEGCWDIPVDDQTNQPNEWQGSLRFAPLSIQGLRHRIVEDLRWMDAWRGEQPRLKFSLGITCIDQVEDKDFQFYDNNGGRRTGLTAFLNECAAMIGWLGDRENASVGRLITCYGEDRADTDFGVMEQRNVA